MNFLLSAPTVSLMIWTLDRHGLISRLSDANGRTAPRSIRILLEEV